MAVAKKTVKAPDLNVKGLTAHDGEIQGMNETNAVAKRGIVVSEIEKIISYETFEIRTALTANDWLQLHTIWLQSKLNPLPLLADEDYLMAKDWDRYYEVFKNSPHKPNWDIAPRIRPFSEALLIDAKSERQELKMKICKDRSDWVINSFCRMVIDEDVSDLDVFQACFNVDEHSLFATRKQYFDLAKMIDRGGNDISDEDSEKGFILLVNYPQISLPKSFIRPHFFRTGMGAYEFFMVYEEEFRLAMSSVFEMVSHGLPVYEKRRKEFIRINKKNENYITMSKLGESCLSVCGGMWPSFVEGLYFKKSEIEDYDVIFSGHWDFPSEKLEMIKGVYRAHVQWNDGDDQASKTKSPLLKSSNTLKRIERALEDFPRRYLNYKTNPPKLDEDVRPWLMDQGYAKNDREKQVIGAIISESFNLKGDTQ